jgi:hypothetical protein
MEEKWHTIKVHVSDDDWLRWRLSLLAKGVTADAVVSAFLRAYVKRSRPVVKSEQAHSRARARKPDRHRGHK